MGKTLHVVSTNGSGGGKDCLFLLGRRRYLRRSNASVLKKHCVRESSADIDTQDGHDETFNTVRELGAELSRRARMFSMPQATGTRFTLQLRGPSSEPVDFGRTALSHGLTSVVPFSVSENGNQLNAVVRLRGGRPRLVQMKAGRPSQAARVTSPASSCRVRVAGPALSKGERADVRATLRRMLALDVDLGPFYELVEDDPLLSWARTGAGRMVRSQTVFEDVVRTICTTNCTFSATRRMITALVERLGDTADGSETLATASDSSAEDRSFPTPSALATAGASGLRELAGLGYRADYVAAIACNVASGKLDLELLRPAAASSLDDDSTRTELLALPGIGPYGAAHAMMLMGRNSSLILDSWSRPAYARVVGSTLDDRAIVSRFARYGPYAGLAFWLVVTHSWSSPPGSTASTAVYPV